jgi:uncharacterized protein (DUF433 family)
MEHNSDIAVESKPGKCGGKPCIRGTRIRVQDIYVWHELQGKSPDDIVSEFPELSLAKVHAALAYFWDHQAEIKAQMKEDRDLIEQIRGSAEPGLLQRLAGKSTTGDTVSS